MTAHEQEIIERTGQAFHVDGIQRARDLTWEAIDVIHSKIEVGMSEEEATQVSNAVLESLGTKRFWHKTLVRFGENTLNLFDQVSRPNTLLKENDIYFLDLGPVFEGFEGDCGKTFTVGNDAEMKRCASDCESLFHQVATRWREGASGMALYEYAIDEASRKGWTLNVGSNGHRLSDFPHKIHFKGSVQELQFHPSPCRWVLEIQIRHPELPYGAFYEDLLV